MTGRLDTEFEQFMQRTSSGVRAYMFCACRNWDDADDLMQECYLRALRSWDQFSGVSSRQAWLFGIARRTRADWYRRMGGWGDTVHIESIDEPVAEAESPGADELEQVWRSIGRLPEDRREVILLKFVGQLSYEQIAQALGVAIETVRSRMHRGLKAIREDIGCRNDRT